MQSNPQILDSQIIRQTRKKGWHLYPPSPAGFVRIHAPTQEDVNEFVDNLCEQLDELATFNTVVISNSETQQPYILRQAPTMTSSTTSPESVILQLGQRIAITRELLPIINLMAGDTNVSYALVRLRDQAQIAVNGGDGGRFLAGSALQDTVTWRRDQYWHPGDLSEFQQWSRQELQPNSDRWSEYRYRASNPETATDLLLPTMQLTTRYRLIDDGIEQYHLALNVDISEIAA